IAHLTYFAYPGQGERNRNQFSYSQAVRVGDRIEAAGQGGWDPKTGDIDASIPTLSSQAFSNVDLNKRDAGGKGWSQVFRVTWYHVPMDDGALEAMVTNIKKWTPEHHPIWTCVGVERLGDGRMKVEIEVVAHDDEWTG
ncbi:putative L-PSP endoribonuclease family protein, partial [Aulographum hederae CBS 113979]